MAIWDRFKKKEAKQANLNFGYGGIPWLVPPERNIKGCLDAYGNIYSLFGIALRIATAVGEVRWRLYKGNERSERNQIAEHPILKLVDFANEFQTGQEIIELTQLHMDLVGRAYWYLPKNKLGIPYEIWVLPPHLVKIVPSKQRFIAGYTFLTNALGVSEVIRFSMPDPVDPYGGIGFAQASAIEIDSEDYAGRWNRNFFYNSARPDAALEYDAKLSDEEFDKLKEQWKASHGGLSNAHKIAILEGGVKYKQIQVNQKDMDFALLRKQTRENLLFTFGMPLSVMGVSENVNRANAEAGDYTFARWLVKPRLTRIKNKLNEQLIPMFPLAKDVELDFDEIVPETIEQKRLLSETGIRSGALTINESRKLLGFDPIPEGDQLLIPLNLIPTPISGEKISPVEQPKSKSKEAIWGLFATKTERQESMFERVFAHHFEQQKKQVMESFGKIEKIDDFLFISDIAYKKTADIFNPAIQEVYSSAFEDAIPARKQIDILDELALEWISTRALLLAKNINQTTLNELRKVLARAFEEGQGIPEISRRIRGYFDENARRRAKMIARTEVIAASNEGALYRYEKEGIDKSEWLASSDGCEECLEEGGRLYPTNESHGLIPKHPNCRCTWLPVVGG